MEDKVVISDILDVLHFAVIKAKGENTLILEELASITKKLTDAGIYHFPVKDVTYWKHLIAITPK